MKQKIIVFLICLCLLPFLPLILNKMFGPDECKHCSKIAWACTLIMFYLCAKVMALIIGFLSI